MWRVCALVVTEAICRDSGVYEVVDEFEDRARSEVELAGKKLQSDRLQLACTSSSHRI